MSKVTALFVATTAITGIVTAYLWQQLHEERQVTAQLRERETQLELALAQNSAVVVAPMLSATISSPKQVVATVPEASRSAPTDPSMQTAAMAVLRQSREGQLAQLRMSLPGAYPDLARELKLTSEQAAALFDLLADQQLEVSNQVSAGMSEEARREFARVKREAVIKHQAALELQLGPEKYRQYRQYQQTLPSRMQIQAVRTTLEATLNPLTDYQQTSLLVSLTDEQKRWDEEARLRLYSGRAEQTQLESMRESLKVAEESNRRVLEAAQSYLNQQQLAALRNSMEQRLRMIRAAVAAQVVQPDTFQR
jgi:hypothetical protein